MDSPNTLVAKFQQIYQSINKSIKQTFGLQTPRKLPTPAKVKHKVSKKLFKTRDNIIMSIPKTPSNPAQTETEKLKEIERKLNWLIKEKMVEVDHLQKSPFTLNPGFDLGLSPTMPLKGSTTSLDTINTLTGIDIQASRPNLDHRILFNRDDLQAAKSSLNYAQTTISPKIPLDLFQEMKSVKLRPTPLQDRPPRQDSLENRLLLDLQTKFRNAEGNEENLLEWSDSESLKGIFE